jgi:hypothetical protein
MQNGVEPDDRHASLRRNVPLRFLLANQVIQLLATIQPKTPLIAFVTFAVVSIKKPDFSSHSVRVFGEVPE